MKKNSIRKGLAGLDFTLGKYEQLCRAIAGSKYAPVTLSEYLGSGCRENGTRHIIMRHDIDRTPKRALGTAEIERTYRIPATYYFRYRRSTYVPEIMNSIASLGHEIGYHYETIDKCRGNRRSALLLFGSELAEFRNFHQVRTVCAHGNPLTKHDNKDIWRNGSNFSDFALLGEAFLSLDYTRFAYYSDSGRTWANSKSQKMEGKDSVVTSFASTVRSTDDVIATVKKGALPNICILTHPERWSGDVVGFTRRYLLDMAFSWGKMVIYTYRKAVNL